VSEWLLLNTNSTIFQLYHGEKNDNFHDIVGMEELSHDIYEEVQIEQID
jgi:hypothetical protein